MAAPITPKNKGTTPAVTAQTALAPNVAPTASNDTMSATALISAVGNVLINDLDGNEDDVLFVAAAGKGAEQSRPVLSAIAEGEAGITLVGVYGSLVIKTDGSYEYTVNAAGAKFKALARGAVATENFTYQVSDGKGGSDKATLAIRVIGANHDPKANDDKASSGNLLANDRDSDAGDRLVVTAAGAGTENSNPGMAPVSSSIAGTLVEGTYGTLLIRANGTYAYTLNTSDADYKALGKGVIATESFTYEISDGNGGTDRGMLAIKVTGVNDKVQAVDDTALSGNLLANDIDPDSSDVLLVTSAGKGAEAANPALSSVPSGSTGLTLTGTYGQLVLKADGSYVYTLDTNDADFKALSGGVTAIDSFTYAVTDGKGSSDKATLAIRVTGANHLPLAINDSGPTGNVLANDRDVDVNDTLSVVAAGKGAEGAIPVLAAVPAGGSGATVTGTFGSLAIKADGSYSYTTDTAGEAFQALTRGATVTENFTYQVSDGNGGTDKATLSVLVTGANHGPKAVDDSGATGTVLGNDTDADHDELTVTAAGAGTELSNPTLTTIASGQTGSTIVGTYGSLQINANGSYSYTLDTRDTDYLALALGDTATETFTYQISDGNGGSDKGAIRIMVVGANRPPVANDDALTHVRGGTGNTGNVLTNDTDADSNLFTVTAVGAGSEEADPDLFTVPSGMTGTIISGTYGTLSIKADGSYSYALNLLDEDFQSVARGQTVTDSFTYRVSDSAENSDFATLDVAVTGVNFRPQAVNDTATATRRDSEPTGNVLSNDIELDSSELLRVTAASVGSIDDGEDFVIVPSASTGITLAGEYGDLLIRADGSYQYKIDKTDLDYLALGKGVSATETFTYETADDQGASDLAELTVTVVGANDNPVARNDESSGWGNVLDNDTDVDEGDIIFVTAVRSSEGSFAVPGDAEGITIEGTYGTLGIRANGDYFYVVNTDDSDYLALDLGESATDVFTYRASDTEGGLALATLTVDVVRYNNFPLNISSFAAAGDATSGQPSLVIPESLFDGTTLLAATASQQSLTADPFALTISATENTTLASASLDTDLDAVAALFNQFFAFDADRAEDDALLILESSDTPGDFGVYQFVSGSDGAAISAAELTVLAVAYATDMTIDQYGSSITSVAS